MNQKKQTKAFTLVELIVVITILAILWTIAFLSLQWYSKDSRDSVRQSDISNIVTSLSLYEIQRWIYPEPTGWVDITFSWWQIWSQWTIWESVMTNLSQLSNKPLDPLTWNEYTYSRLNTKKEFEVAWAIEWWLSKVNPINQANAAWTKVWTAYVKWNYNWLLAKVSTGSSTYILAIPTIISRDVTLRDIIDIMGSWSLVYNWLSNLPSSYEWSIFNLDWWWINFNPLSIVAYTWTTQSLANIDNQLDLLTNLKSIYNGPGSASQNEWIQKILDTTDSSDEAKQLISFIVKNNLYSNAEIYDIPVVNNKTILDCWTTLWEVIYWTPDWYSWSLSCSNDIMICNWSSWSWYIISSCNIWQTDVDWYQSCVDAWSCTTASAGKLFQWWRNKWFNMNDVSQQATTITWSIWLDAWSDTFWYVWHDWLSLPYFWANSEISDNWWDITGTNLSRRWPCQEGYHIPSQDEWIWVSNSKWDLWDANLLTDMKNELRIPYTWLRYSTDWTTNAQWLGSFLWTSSRAPSPVWAWAYISLYSWNIDSSTLLWSIYSIWMPIRCFKN